MIVSVTFIIIVLIIGLLFLGIKMSESIKFKDIKILFFVLFIITLFTALNVISSLYFYIKIGEKKGQKGPRGLQGKIGDRGDSGKCNQETCKVETLKLMIVNEYKKKFTGEEDFNNDIEDVVCGFLSNKEEIEKLDDLDVKQLESIKVFLGINDSYTNGKLNNLHFTKDDLKKKIFDDESITITIPVENPEANSGANPVVNLEFTYNESC